ncbi:MAG: alpha/beta hydrolase, partial [Dactylosporangium sp.]|nr:alpha/beta hydrolase [Dactylosporangium sp.]
MRDAILAIPVDYDTTEIYSGVVRLSGRTWARAVDPDSGPAPTAFLFVHPTSNFLGHYALEPMARRGMTGVGLTTRYAGNDTSLTFENCVLDIASAIRVLRARGHERVILVGNSGGGGLAAMYQSQAEKPTLTGTPLGDGPDLTKHDLPPVDGLVLLMAHPGRAQVYTEWLDPSIVDESNPHLRLPELDMFNPRNGPPYSPEFVQRYRKAQRERSARIRNLVLARLAALAGMDRPCRDFSFVVHGTCA